MSRLGLKPESTSLARNQRVQSLGMRDATMEQQPPDVSSSSSSGSTNKQVHNDMDTYKLKDLPSFISSRFTCMLERSNNENNLNLTNLGISDAQISQIVLHIGRAVWNKIWLSFNKLSDIGVIELVTALYDDGRARFIEELCLASNRLTDSSIVCIAELLKQGNSLRVLDLSANKRVTDASIHLMSELVRSSPMLQKICLNGTSITDNGIRVLLQAVLSSNVRELRLGHDHITVITADMLAAVVRHSCVSQVIVSGPKLNQERLKEVNRLIDVKSSKQGQILVVLCTVHVIPRVSHRSPFRLFPREHMEDLALAMYDFD